MKAACLPAAALSALLGVGAGTVSAADKPAPPEPAVEHRITEDDQVRIDEVRVRGQTQSITVKSKIRGVAPYQIVPSTGAKDPSQIGQGTGQRVWSFSF